MAVNIDKLKKLVEVFYLPPFKIFNINSVDGSNFIRPTGVFVSLGITTSSRTINDIKNIIDSSEEFSASCVKISSKKVGEQYLNTVVDNTLVQFEEQNLPENTYDKEQAHELLEQLREDLNREFNDVEAVQKLAPQLSSLSELIARQDRLDAWSKELIWKDNGVFKIFHKLVNYLKVGDTEYRLGIFVKEKN